MSTLLLRLAAPLQAWGTDSKFEIRRTNREPSKSGVIGMLAAALGLPRNADLSELATLHFGVRVDRNGEVIKDYHTAKGKKAFVTERYYLSDAIFLVGLESENRLLMEKLETALKHPYFPLFLGRRSCPPTLPLVLGIRDKNLETALREEENLNSIPESVRKSYRYIRLDCEHGERMGAIVRDLPISLNPEKREFGFRRAREVWLSEDERIMEEKLDYAVTREHDAMEEL
ncbi:MAG: type I-E CRISPR-associated protein Cas5/CasD [Lachnospiraceae bacterium]|nr:type I-E CRISPR-associated protein Cas5/CasD [Lachnospiraceae bacterium]